LHTFFLGEFADWLNEQHANLAIGVHCPSNDERNDAVLPLGSPESSEIAKALADSRLLVPIWSPSYFHEDHRLCLWEMEFFQKRRLGDIMPVVYAKPETLPQECQNRWVEDFSDDLNQDFPAWNQTIKYGEFVERVRRFADKVAKRIKSAPPATQPDPTLPPVALLTGLPQIDQHRISA
jgi:hypothetical protein